MPKETEVKKVLLNMPVKLNKLEEIEGTVQQRRNKELK